MPPMNTDNSHSNTPTITCHHLKTKSFHALYILNSHQLTTIYLPAQHHHGRPDTPLMWTGPLSRDTIRPPRHRPRSAEDRRGRSPRAVLHRAGHRRRAGLTGRPSLPPHGQRASTPPTARSHRNAATGAVVSAGTGSFLAPRSSALALAPALTTGPTVAVDTAVGATLIRPRRQARAFAGRALVDAVAHRAHTRPSRNATMTTANPGNARRRCRPPHAARRVPDQRAPAVLRTPRLGHRAHRLPARPERACRAAPTVAGERP